MRPNPVGERKLVERARSGDLRAYEDLVRLHQEVAFRTACVFVHSPADAEEAVQDGFVSAWRALDGFRADAPFRPWILAIVANAARDRTKAAHRRRASTERAIVAHRSLAPSTSAAADHLVIEGEDRSAVLGAMRRLPAHQRVVLELRYLLDLSEAEMATVLHCRPGTVKSRLSRALARLRTEIGDAA